jgi:hypothetical protein
MIAGFERAVAGLEALAVAFNVCCPALEASSSACMSTVLIATTGGVTPEVGVIDVLMAFDVDCVTTGVNFAINFDVAANRFLILVLPTRKRCHTMTTSQRDVETLDKNPASILALCSTGQGAKMVAAWFGPGTVFKAFYSFVEYSRVTPLYTSMPTA